MNRRKFGFLFLSISLMVTLLAGGLFGQAVDKDNPYRYLSIFTEVFSLVRSNYVEEVESEKLIAGAFDGLTNAIDEYSYYVPPARMAAYRDFAAPASTGVGLAVSRRFGYGFVVTPLQGSPGQLAGIEAGDFIEQIDGRPTQEMALWEIRSALQGEPGSTVDLVILRGAMNKRETIRIERKAFVLPAVTFAMREGVGYLRIPFFSEQTPGQLREALGQAAASANGKLIIDVRGNADASIAHAIESADLLLSSGTITSLAGRRVEAKTWTADPEALFTGDIVVLADSTSSSAAEIFAAALRDNDRATVVGTRTYGKAVEQKFVKLPSGGALMVTVGDYSTPDDQEIRAEGVRPDVIVDLTPLAIRSQDEVDIELPDLILEKGIEILKAGVAEKQAA
ncbi:MAG TPA: S41 family peptidase [Thermoanaerobaculia bacterium]|nr:S41 family peptidase [Thermoanaerobaculia bacterium]